MLPFPLPMLHIVTTVNLLNLNHRTTIIIQMMQAQCTLFCIRVSSLTIKSKLVLPTLSSLILLNATKNRILQSYYPHSPEQIADTVVVMCLQELLHSQFHI